MLFTVAVAEYISKLWTHKRRTITRPHGRALGCLLWAFWRNWPQIVKFMGPTCGPPGSCRPKMGPMLAQWILLSEAALLQHRTVGSVFFSWHGLQIEDGNGPFHNEDRKCQECPYHTPDSKVHGANMGPIWVLSATDGPHVGPMNLAITDAYVIYSAFIPSYRPRAVASL